MCEKCQACCNKCADNKAAKSDMPESNITAFWRPFVAYVYLLICLFDFILMPTYVEQTKKDVDLVAFYANIQIYKDQPDALQAIINKTDPRPKRWEPITLQGGGMFHIAMGGILGAAAWTRGKEKEAREKK